MLQISDFDGSKIYVLIKQAADVITFLTNAEGTSTNDYKTAANTNGVIVFLEPVGRIWAKNGLYGIGSDQFSELETLVQTLDTAVDELTTSLGTLEQQVSTNTDNIGNLPDTSDPENPIEGSGLLGDVYELLADVAELQDRINDLDPDGNLGNLEEAIAAAVDAKIAEADLVNTTALNTALADKADDAEFQQFKDDVVDRLDDVEELAGTNSQAITVLQNVVSGIPKFSIEILPGTTLPPTHILDENDQPTADWNIYDEQTNPNGIKLHTIYLMRRTSEQDTNEIFTEYIFVHDGNEYKWEKLGSQYFTINNYYTSEEVNEAIQEAIENAVGDALGDDDIAEGSTWYQTLKDAIQQNADDIAANAGDIATNASDIATNASDIAALQTNLTNLTNLLYSLDENQQRVWNFTGDDILTHAGGTTTIGEDIDTLYNKIDWNVIN